MHGKVALITGATSGIGRATALLFAREGASVVAVGRKADGLDALIGDLHKSSGSIRGEVCDVTETEEVDHVIHETVQSHGQIDVLVNCAGIIQSGSIESTSLLDWDVMMNVNLRSMFYTMQASIPHLEAVNGNIVNVSSVTGTRAFPGVLAYCVSKAGVDQLTRCAALELAGRGIRVNAVNPGVVETNLHKNGGMNAQDYERFLENSANTHPLGRAGQPDEVAELIYFLASDKAKWITGVTYAVDGGRAETCAR